MVQHYEDQIKTEDYELYHKLMQKGLVEVPVDRAMVPYSKVRSLYEVGSFIAKGSYGIVQEGKNIITSQQVAVKTVQSNSISKWKMDKNGKRIPQEVFLLQKVKHVRGVLKLLDFTMNEGACAIITEKPRNCCNLSALGQLTETCAKRYLEQVTETLAKCSLAGVLHLDIKGNNIIVDLETDEAKLIDFGCGAEFTHDKIEKLYANQLWGPPEWHLKKYIYGDKCQVWALGILLYRMVTGFNPFESPDEICYFPLVMPHYVSDSCRDLLYLCLYKDYNMRPTYSEIIQHPWFQEE